MIIGKSLTALGGGGLKPEICVTAKAGALLNLHFKDSSIILQTYQLGAEETQHTFVVDVSETAYVVDDATNGKSVEVLVDAVAVFDVKISYWNGVLYDSGTDYEEVTGGLYLTKSNGDATPTMTKESSYLQIKTPMSSDCNLRTRYSVPYDGYAKICFKYSYSTSSSAAAFGVYETLIMYKGKVQVASPASSSLGSTTESGEGGAIAYIANYYTGYLRIHKIWLE